MKIASRLISGMLAGFLYISFPVFAKNESLQTIDFHGVLRVVDCTLNNGKKEAVSFGAVGIHHLDGHHYEQNVPFNLNCTNYAGGDIPVLTMTLEGTPTAFDTAAVVTSVTGLGIELHVNGIAQEINKAMALDYKNPPKLTAVPVADPSVTLSAQSFTGTLKIKVEIP